MNVFFLPALGKWGIARFFPHPSLERPCFLLFLLFHFCTKVATGSVLGGESWPGVGGEGAPSTCFSLVSTVLVSVKRQYSL